ncbi:calcium homeostasis modulator protein 6-like [Sphaeramia orbicularis]|uniref:calcium homeostasis modulator protein 6-like n=1 Tax=Sphaeramia orbicularis TaxID=375764 RepID=UPI00118165C7|nr:calcium homeostasis modulator protein 6-like [Sphaeramia orbicularis]
MIRKAQKGLISYVKTETEKNSGVFYVVTGLLLTGIEKILETEFTCPCQSGWSSLFSAGYFLAPSLLFFVVMLKISGFKCVCSVETVTSVLKSLIPPAIWVILLFLDGRYYVCAKTYWSGHLVKDDSHIPEKWCKPDDTTLAAELEEKTRWWFSESKIYGVIFISLVAVIFVIYHCTICSCGRRFLRRYCLCCLEKLTSCCNQCHDKCRAKCSSNSRDRYDSFRNQCRGRYAWCHDRWVCEECHKDLEEQRPSETETESSDTVPLLNEDTSGHPGNEEE